jgi:hypothetical protein
LQNEPLGYQNKKNLSRHSPYFLIFFCSVGGKRAAGIHIALSPLRRAKCRGNTPLCGSGIVLYLRVFPLAAAVNPATPIFRQEFLYQNSSGTTGK